MNEILKIVFLFLAVWMSIVNTARVIRNNSVQWLNFALQAIGIVGFVYIQFLYVA